VGDQLEKRATDRTEYDEYGPGRSAVMNARHITVALDGTWVRADCSASGRQLHVIAGRIERNGQLGNRFAWVPEAARACSAKMMRSALDDDGYTNETKLSVLADGADGLPRVVQDGNKANPNHEARLVSHQHAPASHRADDVEDRGSHGRPRYRALGP
jgi:hypothetical protein